MQGSERQLNAFVAEPQKHLADAAQLGELAEHMPDRIPHPLVRVHRDRVLADLHVTGRQVQEELPSLGFLATSVVGSLPKNRTLHLADGPPHSEHQSVIRQCRIVDAVAVSEQTADHGAKLQKLMPLTAISGETRSIDG